MLGWFKKKELPKCLICEKTIKDDKFSQVKYRYGENGGTIGTAYLCLKCSDTIDNEKDDEYDESL